MIAELRARLLKWRQTREERKREKLEKELAAHEYDRRHESSPFYDTKGGPN